MLAELAIVPDIFDCACHSSAEACDIHLNYLKEPLLNEVLVGVSILRRRTRGLADEA